MSKKRLVTEKQPIVEKCSGCSQVMIRGKDVVRLKLFIKNPACCKIYVDPTWQWKNGNCVGATFTSYLKLNGPSGSGKTTLTKFIAESCNQSKQWTVQKTGPHDLAITRINPEV